jgi:hypothetical protein
VKLNEIYVINRALDGTEIYALPKLDAPLSDLLIGSVKDGLIKKRILRTHKSFTDEGIRLAQRINLYKTAVKYISVNHLTIGLLDENKGVSLYHNPYFDSYAFEMIAAYDITYSIVGAYAFLQEESEAVDEVDEQVESMKADTLKKRYHIDQKNSLILKTKSIDTQTHEELFFTNSQFHIYNHMKETLMRMTRENLLKIIMERVKIHE